MINRVRTDTPVVSLRGLRKQFLVGGALPWSPKRVVNAVDGVDLELREGEVVALVGQSGSGKTTVSRLILGLERPSAGEIWLDGQRWDSLSEAERRARRLPYQYVPQDAMGALDPQQSALEHVMETLTVLGGCAPADAEAKGMAMLRRLGLAERRDALPREMSGGEQRRVTLARVLALEPRLVVADEPTSGLDPDRRGSVLEDLIGNLPPKAACVLVTHDMSEAREWCHRVVVMLAGRVIEEVDLHAARPAHPYARVLFDPWSGPLPRGELATTGCPFRPDCPDAAGVAGDRCAAEVPALRPRGLAGAAPHRVACHAEDPRQPVEAAPPQLGAS
jgi:ABC-type glutathione transport system ATPase component